MIRARGLARDFTVGRRVVPAVSGVDIDVATGEVVGFLGPNGAGKTTTLRMLTTLLPPSAGDATVAGHDLRGDPAGVRRSIGYVAQGSGAGLDQRVRDELTLSARLYGLDVRAARRRVAELVDQLDLVDVADRLAGHLSGGQRRRADIAMGVVHRPPLLFLDEPSAGLDPQSRSVLWQHVRELRAEHDTTVFLTTHYLDEADALCDRVLVIDGGSIVANGTPDALKARVAGDLVLVTTDDPAGTARVADRVDGVTDLAVDGAAVTFRVPRGDTALPPLLRELDRAGIAVHAVRTHRPTLDDVFLTLTGRSLADTAPTPTPTPS